MINKTLVVISFVLLANLTSGQNFETDYVPIRSFRAPPEMIKDYQFKFSMWSQKSGIDDKRAKAQFVDFCKQKSNFIFILDSLQVAMYTDDISKSLNTIKTHLISENKFLPGNRYEVFTYRSLEPNAFCLGEGIIMISLGLLERLTTLDQVAFVISHEIAHDYLNHTFESAKRFCLGLQENEMRRSLQKVSRNKAGRATIDREIADRFLALHMEYSRENELQADSLGYFIFANAGFEKTEASEVLKILDASDHLLYQDTIRLQEYFDFPHYPFKTYWLVAETSMLKWDVDSSIAMIPDDMKSHPDCSERLARLANLSNNNESTDNIILPDAALLDQYADIVHFEVVEALMKHNDYTLALYLSLQLQQYYPLNIYLRCVTAHCLYELSEAFVQNEFLEYVEFPNQYFSKGYNHMLIFLHNLNSSTLHGLFHHSFHESLAQIPSHAYVDFLRILDEGKPINADTVAAFEKKYDHPVLTELLKSKVPVPAPLKTKKK